MSDTLNLFARFSAWRLDLEASWVGHTICNGRNGFRLRNGLRNGLRPDRLRKRHKPAKRHAPASWRAPAIFFVPLDQPLDGVLAVQSPKPSTVVHDWGSLGADLWLAGRHGQRRSAITVSVGLVMRSIRVASASKACAISSR